MNDNSALNTFPTKRIKPYDGMSITAEVWAMAHEEHHQALQAHDLYFHGSGIISGLEVLANDPPDQYVFISPGVAVDSAGNVIVVTEQVAYDFGKTVEGTLYLLLGRGEREVGGGQNELRFAQDEYVVAARPNVPRRPAVELARVTLGQRGSAVKNATDPKHLGPDELDLRFRQEISPAAPLPLRVGLCSLGKGTHPELVSGWDYLAQECQRVTPYRLIIDSVPFPSDLQNYAVVYLAGSGSFTMAASGVKELSAYLGQGKTILIEPQDAAAEGAFATLLKELGVTLQPAGENDAVMRTPNVFCAPPEGNLGNAISFGKGVVYSAARYALAWNGKVRAGEGTRADIRSALEWGVNLIEHCLRPA
jgi:hypothetical protein